jgi:transcription-repair coupling factor (superfamily II helicase)
MSSIFEPLFESADFKNIVDSIGSCIVLYDMPESMRVFVASAISQYTGRQLIYIAPSSKASERVSTNASSLLGSAAGHITYQDIQFVQGTYSKERTLQNRRVLSDVIKGDIKMLCLSPECLMQRFPLPDFTNIIINIGDIFEPQELIKTLVNLGYERVSMVEGKGQCALRGDILDIFPPLSDIPYRIEFFDTEIDSIRPFDTLSQRSESGVNSIEISPAPFYIIEESKREYAAENIINLIESESDNAETASDMFSSGAAPLSNIGRMELDMQRLKATGFFPSIHLWYPLIEETLPIERYIKNAIIVIDTPNSVFSRIEREHEAFLDSLKQAVLRGDAIKKQAELCYTVDEIKQRLLTAKPIIMQDMLLAFSGFVPEKLFNLSAKSTNEMYRGNFAELAKGIKEYTGNGFAVGIATQSENRAKRIQSALSLEGFAMPDFTPDDYSLTHDKAVFIPISYYEGFIYDSAKIAIITQSDLYGSAQRKRVSPSKSRPIEAFIELNKGDYVVHEMHGIGVYEGTVRLQSEGTWRDYLYIRYQGSDKLYIPVDQFDRVQKYIGSEGYEPKLDSLNSTSWQKQKAKVKSSLKKLAFNLVELYAQREATPGFAFEPSPAWEEEFNDNFEFELTPDQQSAIDEVLSDMEKPKNMDRLLLGDVGFGKTEVAMRAAFRAVINGKQVALLAPTTILVEQHYHSFIRRFRGFPVKIAKLSRFQSPAQNKTTLIALFRGEIDIVIGTHRLLSKDVKFKNLGLLIVDEEQRFGVGHKESIKNIKKTVDVLTLSATPIPRTLHMSMVGIRDMSIIETPPEERQPVQSYVVSSSAALIRDVILRELGRGGQVYFLYNRVQRMEDFAARIRRLVPEAKIAIAHGQLRSNVLEDIMMDFSMGRYDVLLCSTIIENGLDIPNVNTLIVYDADRFGLGQLYQLRGRVGRSARKAYAYFLVRPDKALSEVAEKRLSAIKQFTEFGAGFRIAMRDIQIRGAGNIFGPEQSGQMSAIGYDMYCKMLERAVLSAQGKLVEDTERDTRVDMNINAYLPESYVDGQAQRIEIYKRISWVKNDEDKQEVIALLIDRFGEPPEEVIALINISLLRSLASNIGSDLVMYKDGILTLRLNPDYIKDPEMLLYILKDESSIKLTSGKTTRLLIKTSKDAQEALKHGIETLERLNNKLSMAQIDNKRG